MEDYSCCVLGVAAMAASVALSIAKPVMVAKPAMVELVVGLEKILVFPGSLVNLADSLYVV